MQYLLVSAKVAGGRVGLAALVTDASRRTEPGTRTSSRERVQGRPTFEYYSFARDLDKWHISSS